MELLGHRLCRCSTLLGNATCFQITFTSWYIHSQSMKVPLLHMHTNVWYWLIFNSCHSGRCEIVLHYGICWRRQWHPTPVLLPGKSHGWRSLEGCSPWGRWGSDTTERLHFHFSLSCIGEGNGNPLQCSCLENPRDRAAWWAAVYGVTQSQTRLKWLSSSSSRSLIKVIEYLVTSIWPS